MVSKIQKGEYLKRYNNMTVTERAAYEERVGEWLRTGGRLLENRAEDFDARLQNVVTLSAGWNDLECQSFEVGAQLLSALVGRFDTWLPDLLYVKAMGRCFRRMRKLLSEIMEKRNGEPEVTVNGDETPSRKNTGTDTDGHKKAEVEPLPSGTVVSVPRPRHIDQYVHLLPKKTQERAAEVRGLLRDLDVARENARKLMESGEQGDKVAQWARTATKLDDKVRSIYRELDAEWENLVRQGRVVVDEFGNASVIPLPQSDETPVTEKTELTSEQKAIRRELRKWLGDRRRGNGNTREKHVKKWKESYKELLELEGPTAAEDKKIVEAATHYGIDLSELRTGE